MRRKKVPKARTGPGGVWRRSVRMRQVGGAGRAFDAAERSIHGSESASLCGIKGEKKKINI
jgi:hypothetical protein